MKRTIAALLLLAALPFSARAVVTVTPPGGGAGETATYTGDKTITGGMHVTGTTQLDGAIGLGVTAPADIVVDGGFANTANWTEGTGWSLATGAAVHTGGTAGTLVPTVALTPTIGVTYQITYTLTAPDTRSLSVAFGGVTVVAGDATSATHTVYVTAGSTGNLTLTPTTAGTTITVDDISVKAVTSAVSPFAGPVLVQKTMADASADESVMTVSGTQSGAGGDKTLLKLHYNGSVGTGNESFIEAFNAAGTSTFSVGYTGDMSVAGTHYSTGINRVSGGALAVKGAGGVGTSNNVQLGPYGTITRTSGDYSVVIIDPAYNEASGTAGNTDLKILRTETAVGSGTQRLIDAGTAAYPSMWNVGNRGHVNTKAGVASPALSSCGTGPAISTGSSDYAGVVTVPADGAACTVTFNVAYVNTPACVVAATSAGTVTITAQSSTAFTVTPSANGVDFNYVCVGVNE